MDPTTCPASFAGIQSDRLQIRSRPGTPSAIGRVRNKKEPGTGVVDGYLPNNDNNVFYIMTQHGLGEFEQMVLLALAHLGGEAYGVPIVDEIERRTVRSVARAAVYITLRRLEEKGFVSSLMSDPTPQRGGKARRYVRLEAPGARALREARRVSERMWHGLDPASLRAR